MPATISISHYCGQQEQSYQNFPVTVDGLREAREVLNTRMAKRFRYGVSPWQFDSSYESVGRATELVQSGNVADLERLLNEDAPTI